MNRSSNLRRKLIYVGILLAMLIPMFLLGQPVGSGGKGGGQLAVMRTSFDIAESNLGEISPASETMRLSSLGLRGIAASLLWQKSHEYHVKHEWDRFKATLNQIALLQPHYARVWEFQAHNLAYNVSTEFDDYRQRYETVREGTEFLTKGVKQNTKATRLIWYTGWFYGQKMGMSDEKRQFRRLFADDEVIHNQLMEQGIAVDSPEARGPLGKPDNWLVGRLWLNHGYDLVESGIKIRNQTPINFYESGPKWRIKHAEAIESEGILDERAQNAWQMALTDWTAFGNRPIPTTASFTVKLDQLDEVVRRRREVIARMKELDPAAYERAIGSQIKNFSPTQQEAWNTLASERSEAQESIVEGILQTIEINYDDLARDTKSEVRLEAVRLAGELKDLAERELKTSGYRKQINYEYWKTLTQAEQEERTVRARRLIYEAEKANADAELDQAITLYEQAFQVWSEIFDDYPILVIDDSAQDLFESVKRYLVAIDSDNLPDEFPLKTFVELMGEYGQVDQEMYEEVRNSQKTKLEARKKELEEEERRLEKEAEMALEAKAKADEEAKAKPEMKSEEPVATEMKADAPASDEPKPEEPTSEALESEDPKSKDSSAEEKENAETKVDETQTEEPKPEESSSEEPNAG